MSCEIILTLLTLFSHKIYMLGFLKTEIVNWIEPLTTDGPIGLVGMR